MELPKGELRENRIYYGSGREGSEACICNDGVWYIDIGIQDKSLPGIGIYGCQFVRVKDPIVTAGK